LNLEPFTLNLMGWTVPAKMSLKEGVYPPAHGEKLKVDRGDCRDKITERLRSIERKSLAAACAMVLGSLAYRSVYITLGVLLGGAISLVNFRLLWRIAEPAFRPTTKQHGMFALRFVVKMVGLLAVIFLVIYLGMVHIIGFVVGLSAVVVGIVLEGIVHLYRPPGD
jgi:hypothetical protein